MEGITSHETQLKVLSIVDNVQAELDRIEEENEAPKETVVDRLMFADAEEMNDEEVDAEGLEDEQ
jgi:F0F1-type ATP synthase membrane subunit b/b'